MRMVLAAVSLLLLAGCAAADADNADVDNTPSPSLKYGGVYHLPAEFQEWEELYQQHLDKLATQQQAVGLGAPPTDVQFVRFITPEQYASTYVSCMHEQGFTSVSETFDGGLDYGNYPPDQGPAVVAAAFRCEVQFPVHPRYSLPLTPEQLRITYDYYVSELVPCLAREGYPVDSSKIPTLETFEGTYEQDGAWNPYDVVTDKQRELSGANGGVLPPEWPAEWERINKACPQSVPLERLWPDS